MTLSDDVRHAALAPVEAVMALYPPGDTRDPYLTLDVIAAAHEGVISALVLLADAVEKAPCAVEKR